MVSQTNEQALEAAIEKRLTGFCLEEIGPGGPSDDELHAPDVPFGDHHGYRLGHPQDFNPQYAIDETRFWDFLRNTQPKELEKLQRASANRDEFKRKILERFDRLV
ncbi:MAG: type I restriction endonuclease subunit R, partial [Desulfococcaceae bacterium]